MVQGRRDVAEALIKLQNEKLAELCAAQPDRFVAFASVALQYPDLAAEQLDDAVKKLGLRGAAIGGSVNGEELADPKFHPFWKKAEELGCLVFIHPQATPDLEKRLKGNGGLINVIGNPLETTIALSHLIFEGTLDRFPGLKICAAHGGGYLPSYAARSDPGCPTFPDRCNAVILKKKPTEYLRQLYFDSLIFTPEALRHLVGQVGASQIVIGTDYPFPWTKTSVDHILDTPSLTMTTAPRCWGTPPRNCSGSSRSGPFRPRVAGQRRGPAAGDRHATPCIPKSCDGALSFSLRFRARQRARPTRRVRCASSSAFRPAVRTTS